MSEHDDSQASAQASEAAVAAAAAKKTLAIQVLMSRATGIVLFFSLSFSFSVALWEPMGPAAIAFGVAIGLVIAGAVIASGPRAERKRDRKPTQLAS